VWISDAHRVFCFINFSLFFQFLFSWLLISFLVHVNNFWWLIDWLIDWFIDWLIVCCVQCFDLESYLMFNTEHCHWFCPICRLVKFFNDKKLKYWIHYIIIFMLLYLLFMLRISRLVTIINLPLVGRHYLVTVITTCSCKHC